MDETSLFWKQMPERTFIYKETKSMDRIPVVWSQGYRLKPFVIWLSENPRAFQCSGKHALPLLCGVVRGHG